MEYYSTFLFVMITSITPGPNNISAFNFSLGQGYLRTLNYIFGIATGTCLVLFLSGLLIGTITGFLKEMEVYLRYIAAFYIVYLAYKSLKLNVSIDNQQPKSPSFLNGFVLQLVNPKAIFYAITLYSSFLALVTENHFSLGVSAIVLSMVTFLTVSLWAVSGSLLLRFLKNKKVIRAVGVGMALILVAFAINIIGFI